MLVKTSVARRVLAHLWRTGTSVEEANIYRFDASLHFGVSADACLFYCRIRNRGSSLSCAVSELDRPKVQLGKVDWREGVLVSDPVVYDKHRALVISGPSSNFRWRSGVKHDCSAVMELKRIATTTFVNGNGEHIELEAEYVYPLLKGTDLVHRRVSEARKWLLVTQVRPGEDTSVISRCAPKTWTYLCANSEQLDSRRSSIYRGKPRFSVFGVGPYSFTPWKVAISALHKRLVFSEVGPIDGRPAMFDDTCYHLSCESQDGARLLTTLLNSTCSQELLGSLVFWDAKRPITSEILQRLNLRAVAETLGLSSEFDGIFSPAGPPSPQATFEFDSAAMLS